MFGKFYIQEEHFCSCEEELNCDELVNFGSTRLKVNLNRRYKKLILIILTEGNRKHGLQSDLSLYDE